MITDSDPACPECGVAYHDHLGLHGTCRRAKEAEKQRCEALELVDEWKAASGLITSAGDPDGITPDGAIKYWGDVEAELKLVRADFQAFIDDVHKESDPPGAWEYRGQVVRDVKILREQRDKARREVAELQDRVTELDALVEEMASYPGNPAGLLR